MNKDIQKEVAGYRDGLGQPVDAGIFDVVVALRKLGFVTDSSCQGHPERSGAFYPYVTLAYPAPMDMNDTWTAEEQENWQRQNLAQQEKLITLLTDFYATRNVPYNQQLTVNTLGAGISQLRPTTGDITQTITNLNQRQNIHQQYLQEFGALVSYLKVGHPTY